ncbi:hypothetical protein [Clostridium estertheticum]|uniref:hypothetical protein n=1 Tax=Clostridium estertheticum TaxID=238834 RepID=UPI001C0E33AC|nr:hypothetical protein [Clostridium estertheticum]MBU3173254.1 hypothetical protein [Clostridium estertheticum]
MLDYTNSEYWKKVREKIYNKRTQYEKKIFAIAFISLKDCDQKSHMEIEDREKNEFAKELGYEMGSEVVNKVGEIFKVRYMIDGYGTLDLDHLSITIENSERYEILYTRSANVYWLKEGNYFDNYLPVKKTNSKHLVA